MTVYLGIFLAVVILLQMAIGHLIRELGFSFPISIALMCLPLGIGVFLLQIVYYEQYYPDWEVALGAKLRLKYMYLLTFFEFVAVYICFFVF